MARLSWKSGFLSLAALLALAAAAPAGAAEEDFIDRFAGNWAGAGMVQRDLQSRPMRVKCDMSGESAGNAVSVAGTCRALAVFSRRIAVDVRYDPSSGRYVGTYAGSRIGTAGLSGRREGAALNLTVTWPKDVNGDRTAQMTIRNQGAGRLDIVVTDEAEGGGERVRTTSLTLARK